MNNYRQQTQHFHSGDDMSVHDLLKLRGIFRIPSPVSNREPEEEHEFLYHALPVDEEHIIIHTSSSVKLLHLPTQTTLWQIVCNSFNVALDSHHCLLAVTPGEPASTILVIDLGTGNVLHQFATEVDDEVYHISYNGLAFSPDGQKLAVGIEAGNQNYLALWNMVDGSLLHMLETSPTEDMTAIAFHPQSEIVAGGSFNGYDIWLWPLAGEHNFHIWEYPDDAEKIDRTYQLAFSLDGRLLFAACGDAGLRIWDVQLEQEVDRPETELGVMGVTVCPDGQHIAMVDMGGVRVLEIGSCCSVLEVAGEGAYFSPDGKLLATLGGMTDDESVRDRIRLWRLETGELLTVV